MREISREFIVISAERADHSIDRNTADTKALRDLLRAGPSTFRELVGTWKGIAEASFAVILSTDVANRVGQVEALLRLGHAFNQDALLHVDSEREVALIAVDDASRSYLGRWVESSNADDVVGRDHSEYFDQSGQCHYAWVE